MYDSGVTLTMIHGTGKGNAYCFAAEKKHAANEHGAYDNACQRVASMAQGSCQSTALQTSRPPQIAARSEPGMQDL
jgi:hypothetical protein